eukprot:8850191-Prorocentrum_lima.AAC.1
MRDKNIINIYAPHQQRQEEEKDTFWKRLQEAMEKLEGDTWVVGDCNARVDWTETEWEDQREEGAPEQSNDN